MQQGAAEPGQYSISKIALVWAAAALPMMVLGWGIAPAVEDSFDAGVGEENQAVFTRAVFLTLGLAWQFLLSMILILREEGDLHWTTVRRRCWLNAPRDPQTGQPRGRLWWWVVPFILGFGLLELIPLQALWEALFPFLDEPAKYSFSELLESDERKKALEGAWQLVALFIVLGVFNTILGEELLFRGILLPKMSGVFGKRDWVANGVIFGFYHLHQPWGIFLAILSGLLFAYPSRRFHSAWMGIIIHSTQTVFFILVSLGLVLGMA